MLSSTAEKPYRFPRLLVSGTMSGIGWRPVARHVLWQPRRAFSHRRENLDGAALGVAAMDLLRARLQGSPTRRLGPLLHRAVFSRRTDPARCRPSALLRVPPQGSGRLC